MPDRKHIRKLNSNQGEEELIYSIKKLNKTIEKKQDKAWDLNISMVILTYLIILLMSFQIFSSFSEDIFLISLFSILITFICIWCVEKTKKSIKAKQKQ